MTRVLIDQKDAKPGDIAVMKRVEWPAEIEAEVYGNDYLAAAGYTVLFPNGGIPDNSPVVRVYREVPALPTEPGSVIRATIRGVPDMVAMLDDDDDWYTARACGGHNWHSRDHVDQKTVVLGQIVFGADT